MLISSFMIDLLYPFHDSFLSYVQFPVLISSIIGGVLVGLGIGMMLCYETSTGGTDLLAQFLSRIFRVNVGIMIFIIDAIVICMGGLLQRLCTEMILSLVLTGEINKIGRL